jgi:hypothetical protein
MGYGRLEQKISPPVSYARSPSSRSARPGFGDLEKLARIPGAQGRVVLARRRKRESPEYGTTRPRKRTSRSHEERGRFLRTASTQGQWRVDLRQREPYRLSIGGQIAHSLREIGANRRCSRPFCASRKIMDRVRAEACGDCLPIAVVAPLNIGLYGPLNTGGDGLFRHD